MSKNTIFEDTAPIHRKNVFDVLDIVKLKLPENLKNNLIRDIGSAGYKSQSNDIDLFLDERIVTDHYKSPDSKTAKQELKNYFSDLGIKSTVKARNVHVDIPYETNDGVKHAQVDIMVIPNARKVADWHQHGLRGMYIDPNFRADHLYILLNSIGKYLGYKVDAFGGVVMRRDSNEVVADNREDAAKLLLNQGATANDLDSVKTVMKALEHDIHREDKLRQAYGDVEKGLLVL